VVALAVGCVRGDFGRDILYLGVSGLDTPIWDVLAPEEAPNRSRTGSISPGFPIRQAVPLGLARARFCCWAGFFVPKILYFGSSSVSNHIIPCSMHLRRRE
jgi:hypothetical protein